MIQQFGDSLESRWYKEHSLRIHKKHLEDIKQRSKSTIKSHFNHNSPNLRKLSQENDKHKEIDRENMILFVKLNQIKERRSSPRESKGPKSLNFSLRKKQAEKIMTENYDFVRRFIIKPSFISARQLEEEYKQQQGYKRTISKANLHKRLIRLASFDGKPGQLPPMEYSTPENVDNSRTEVPSKLTNILSNASEIFLNQKIEEKESCSKIEDSNQIDDIKPNEKSLIKNQKDDPLGINLKERVGEISINEELSAINNEKIEKSQQNDAKKIRDNSILRKNADFNDKKNSNKSKAPERAKKELRINKDYNKSIDKHIENVEINKKNISEDIQESIQTQLNIRVAIDSGLRLKKSAGEKYQEDILSISFLI